jgi:hypothetical protein
MDVPHGTVEETIAYLSVAMPRYASTQHLISNMILELDGDSASTRTICFNPLVTTNGGEHVLFVGAWYRDALARTSDGWRIRHRYVERSYAFNEHTAG